MRRARVRSTGWALQLSSYACGVPRHGTSFRRADGTKRWATARRLVMEAILTFAPLALFLFLLVIDAVRPARRQPRVRGWTLIGIVSMLAFVAVSLFAPLLWLGTLANHRLIDATGLGTAGGAIVGVLVLDLATFAWHYALHEVPFLWRWFHQVHHS